MFSHIFRFLPLLLLLIPLLYMVQELAVRLGIFTGRGHGELIRERFSKGWSYLALAGLFVGVLGSLAVSRLVAAFLFGVSSTDPLVYAATIATMCGISILATALPANRAASADPVEALRAI